MDDPPQATVLVLPAAHVRLAATGVPLPGGGTADVFEDEDGDQLVQVTAGRVRPEELVRGALRTPGCSIRGSLLDLVVVTDRGWDRHVVAADLRTRLLHARHHTARSEQGGRSLVVIGPPVDDALEVDAPSSVAVAVARLVGRGSRPVGRLTELPLVGDPRRAEAGGRRAEALRDADVVVAAWGEEADRAELDVAVDDTLAALRTVRERGGAVLVRTRGDRPDAVGAGAHPTARSDLRPGDGLTLAPADWLYGAPLG